jgi:hypothetical protein
VTQGSVLVVFFLGRSNVLLGDDIIPVSLGDLPGPPEEIDGFSGVTMSL